MGTYTEPAADHFSGQWTIAMRPLAVISSGKHYAAWPLVVANRDHTTDDR